MYQALYRKWRPRSFDDVVGQRHITDTLKSQVRDGRLSHAYLFIGTRGTGKTTCAKILAKAVNCEHPVDGNPCNQCRSCRGIDDGSILDVVEMDAASNNGVDNVRQLRDEAVFSPAAAKKRVYIIDEVHMLSTSAFNALLKILEEPPEHLMFILATTELNKVPATILSRCQRHSFKRLDTESIVSRLLYVAGEEKLDLTPEAAELIAGLSEGGMRDALSILDQCSGRTRIDPETVYSAMGLAGRREIAQMLRHIAGRDAAGAIGLFQRLWQDGKDPSTLLGELSTLMRDILMLSVAPTGGRELLTGGYDEATLAEFSKSFSTGALINSINIIQSSLADMRSGQAKTICELCLITLCEPELGESLPLLRERVARLEQAVRSGVSFSPAPAAAQAAPAPAQAAPVQEEPYPQAPPPTDQDAPFDAPPFDVPFDVPEKKPAPQAAPAPAPTLRPVVSLPSDTPVSAIGSGGDAWDKIRDALNGAMPMGLYIILTDPGQVTAEISGDALELQIQPGFAMNMLDRPDVCSQIGGAASAVLGRPIHVVVSEMGAAPVPKAQTGTGSKLDELAKFDIVKFK
ncbi:MAG: DNA polymerase III subunit gamma/tau [Oscillospiraceae bacterium]